MGDEDHRVSCSKLFEDVLLLAKVFRRRGVSHGDTDGGKEKGFVVAARLFQAVVWASSAYRRNKRKALGTMPVFAAGGTIVQYAEKLVASAKMVLLFPLYVPANKKHIRAERQVIRQRNKDREESRQSALPAYWR